METRKNSRATVIAALIVKSGTFYKAITVAKIFAPLITILSMTLSLAVYALLISPWFAVGLVSMLFIHEMGHVMAFRAKGIKVSAPVFIPLLGAVLFGPRINDPEDEAYIAYAGPLVGGAASLLLFLISILFPTPPKMLVITSHIAAFFNLFNLIPIRPLDGGRITQTIGPWFQRVGLAALLLVTIASHNPAIVLIWIILLTEWRTTDQVRSIAGLILMIIMMILVFTRLSPQGAFADGIDLIMAATFNAMLAYRTHITSKLPVQPVSVEPVAVLPRAIRLKWLVLYLGLASALLTLYFVQLPYLPAQFR